jgi:hypothetical protein
MGNTLRKKTETFVGPCSKFVSGQGWTTEIPVEEIKKKGWIKPDEDAVVLTVEELAQIQSNFFDAGIKHGSKETAEKFAKNAKEGAFVDFMGEPIIRASKIDEICKEITEGLK